MESGEYGYTTHTVQQQQPSLSFPAVNFPSEVASSGISLLTISSLTLLVREIRFLVKACKGS
ncbi:hypothetical protein [Phormidium nigroviride]